MSGWNLTTVTDWLLAEGRFASSLDDLSGGLAHRIVEAGSPIWRLRLGVRTLHPMITALSSAWERENGVIPIVQAPHGLEDRASYRGSPMEIISESGVAFRRDLTKPLKVDDHAILQELKNRGATDYFGQPLRFTTSPNGLFLVATGQSDGFSDGDIEKFTQLSQTLSPVIEIFRLRHTMTAISNAYLGPRSAERVLSGQITPGHVETIRAAILFSDIRGWTAINTRRPPIETVALANRYFDILTNAINAHGGEVLKLMGDGILAIFPDEGDDRACAHALEAAQSAHAEARADPPFPADFGIAMHVGHVLYGNVGSETRLDFTVLGAAVNFAARLEGLCTRYQRDILFSKAFADQLDIPVERLGTEALKGLETPQPVYAVE